MWKKRKRSLGGSNDRGLERQQGISRCGLHGGTLSTQGMVFVNRCSWTHCFREAARLLQLPDADLLNAEERQALDGMRSPHGVIVSDVAG